MALVLNDEQIMIRESADGFFREKAPVAELRRLRDTRDETGFSRDLWKSMAEMGFTGVLIPEEHGGSGFGYVGAGLIQEAIGKNLSQSPMLSTAILGATALLLAGSEAQKGDILPKIAAGEIVLALAVDEKARHNPASIETRATASGNGYSLSGRKSFVLDGHVADRLIVAARAGEAGDIGLFLVDPKAGGVTVTRTIMVDNRNAAEVSFADAPAELLGTVGEGASLLDRILDAGRVCLAAELLGVAQQSFNTTIDYLKQREQFGQKIGSFQALQHRAAHLFCEVEVARSAVLRALQALDGAEEKAPLFASLAKAKATEVAKLATNEAVQMHGGMGMTDEFDVGFYMKRARAAGETFGDASFHGDRMARMMGY